MKAPARASRKQPKGSNGSASNEASVREDQILEVAARLFKERGYHGATLQDIAQEIGVTRTAVYHYFSSKEEVFLRIAEHAIETVPSIFEEIASSDAPPEEKMRRLLHDFIQANLRNGPNWWLLLTEGERNLPPNVYRRLYRTVRQNDAILQRVFREGVQSGKFVDLDPKISVFAMAGACNWLARWYSPRGQMEPDRIADTFMQILERGYLAQ